MERGLIQRLQSSWVPLCPSTLSRGKFPGKTDGRQDLSEGEIEDPQSLATHLTGDSRKISTTAGDLVDLASRIFELIGVSGRQDFLAGPPGPHLTGQLSRARGSSTTLALAGESEVVPCVVRDGEKAQHAQQNGERVPASSDTPKLPSGKDHSRADQGHICQSYNLRLRALTSRHIESEVPTCAGST